MNSIKNFYLISLEENKRYISSNSLKEEKNYNNFRIEIRISTFLLFCRFLDPILFDHRFKILLKYILQVCFFNSIISCGFNQNDLCCCLLFVFCLCIFYIERILPVSTQNGSIPISLVRCMKLEVGNCFLLKFSLIRSIYQYKDWDTSLRNTCFPYPDWNQVYLWYETSTSKSHFDADLWLLD